MGGDLEDKILRRNIPGRYSDHVDDTAPDDRHQHESDNDSGYGNSDEDNDESNEDAEESSRHASLSRMKEMDSDGIPESVYRSIEAKRMAAPNSGVKGVLADYRRSQALAAARKEQEEIHRREVLYRIATGRGPPGSSGGQMVVTTPQETVTKLTENDDSDDDLLDDDEFMEQFRQQRLAQLKSKGCQNISDVVDTSSSSSGMNLQQKCTKPLPYFGEVVDIDEFDATKRLQNLDGSSAQVNDKYDFFLYHLNNVDSRVTTVVHTYESDIKLCTIVNDHLDKIAASHPHVKFIKIMASVNGLNIDPVAMPALSIYRDGNCIDVLTDIAEEVAGDGGFSCYDRFSRNDVELTLRRYL